MRSTSKGRSEQDYGRANCPYDISNIDRLHKTQITKVVISAEWNETYSQVEYDIINKTTPYLIR